MRHRWFSNITAQRTLKPNTAPGGFTNPILIPGRRCENQRHDLLILLPLEWNLHGSASSEMEQFLTMPRLVIGIPLTFPWSPFTGNVIIIAKTHIYSIHNLAKMRKGCEASHLRIWNRVIYACKWFKHGKWIEWTSFHNGYLPRDGVGVNRLGCPVSWGAGMLHQEFQIVVIPFQSLIVFSPENPPICRTSDGEVDS